MAMYNARMPRRFRTNVTWSPLLVVLAACFQVACTGNREVENDLKIVEARTGWYDAGIVDGKNKIVPSIAFKLHNVSAEEIGRVQVNAIFHRVNETEPWGEHFAPAIGSDGLATNAVTNEIVLRGNLGYTSPDQSRATSARAV